MKYDYLFFEAEFPSGIQSVCINGKRFSRTEFLKLKKEYLEKKKQQD